MFGKTREFERNSFTSFIKHVTIRDILLFIFIDKRKSPSQKFKNYSKSIKLILKIDFIL